MLKSTRSRSNAFILLTAFLAGCAASDKSPEPAKLSETNLEEEVSLKEDRAELDELRKDMPEEVRRENDEVAFILKNMAGMEEEPSKVRDRFQTAVRKRREKMDKSLRKERDDFSANERTARETFLREQQDAREKFNAGKRDQKDRRRFFDEQDGKRRDFFDKQKDKRKDFEESVTERRKKFEDYFREQTNKFNQEHRAYTDRFNERRKALELKKRMEQKDQQLKRQEAKTTGSATSEQIPSQLPPGMTAEDAALLEEMAKHKAPSKVQPLKTEDK